jgi:lipoate-protein ligase B
MSEICLRVDLGRADYVETWELQRRLVARRQAGEIEDALIFVEHPPTYTLGRGGARAHLLASQEELSRLGARFVATDRGGDITFHGPGQIVGYPILDLEPLGRDVHFYLRRLEEVLIRALAHFGLEAGREAGLTGVWHREGKLAAIGVRVARWVSSHGFALNVSTDLAYFDRIVPCGIVGRRVTSMEKALGRPVDAEQVKDAVSAELGFVFDRNMLAVSPSWLKARTDPRPSERENLSHAG